jgi:hypothetical protein
MKFSGSQSVTIPKNTPLDREKWCGIVNAWDANKESQKAYCRRLGISSHTFSYVRGKLIKKNSVQSPFIPVTVSKFEEKNLPESMLLTLEHPRGFKLHLSPSLSLEQLAKILTLSGWKHD